jgi:hypothetical protein
MTKPECVGWVRYGVLVIRADNHRPAFLATVQPAVHLLLDGLGEASDFTFWGFIHNFNFYGRIYPDIAGCTRILRGSQPAATSVTEPPAAHLNSSSSTAISASIALVPAKLDWARSRPMVAVQTACLGEKGQRLVKETAGRPATKGELCILPRTSRGQDRGKIGWGEWETFNIQHPTSKGQNVTGDRTATEEETKQKF